MKQRYTVKEICQVYGKTYAQVSNNIYKRQHLPKRYAKTKNKIGGTAERYFYLNEIDLIFAPITKKPTEDLRPPTIITYHRVLTFHIYESKLNYTELTKL